MELGKPNKSRNKVELVNFQKVWNVIIEVPCFPAEFTPVPFALIASVVSFLLTVSVKVLSKYIFLQMLQPFLFWFQIYIVLFL